MDSRPKCCSCRADDILEARQSDMSAEGAARQLFSDFL